MRYPPICSVDNCQRYHFCRGYYNRHYQVAKKYGNPLTTRFHGLRNTAEYQAWVNMKSRCYYPRHESYKNYGARGITVCRRWHDFRNFYADMGARPSPTHSLDRIDNDADYSPNNCRWATKSEQNLNRRPRGSVVC